MLWHHSLPRMECRKKKCTWISEVGDSKYNLLFSFLNNRREKSDTRPESQVPMFCLPSSCPPAVLPSWDCWIPITTQQKPFLYHTHLSCNKAKPMNVKTGIIKRRTFHQDHQIVKTKKITTFRLKMRCDTWSMVSIMNKLYFSSFFSTVKILQELFFVVSFTWSWKLILWQLAIFSFTSIQL